MRNKIRFNFSILVLLGISVSSAWGTDMVVEINNQDSHLEVPIKVHATLFASVWTYAIKLEGMSPFVPMVALGLNTYDENGTKTLKEVPIDILRFKKEHPQRQKRDVMTEPEAEIVGDMIEDSHVPVEMGDPQELEDSEKHEDSFSEEVEYSYENSEYSYGEESYYNHQGDSDEEDHYFKLDYPSFFSDQNGNEEESSVQEDPHVFGIEEETKVESSEEDTGIPQEEEGTKVESSDEDTDIHQVEVDPVVESSEEETNIDQVEEETKVESSDEEESTLRAVQPVQEKLGGSSSEERKNGFPHVRPVSDHDDYHKYYRSHYDIIIHVVYRGINEYECRISQFMGSNEQTIMLKGQPEMIILGSFSGTYKAHLKSYLPIVPYKKFLKISHRLEPSKPSPVENKDAVHDRFYPHEQSAGVDEEHGRGVWEDPTPIFSPGTSWIPLMVIFGIIALILVAYSIKKREKLMVKLGMKEKPEPICQCDDEDV